MRHRTVNPKRELLDILGDRLLVGDGCWQWTGDTFKGYGKLWRDKKSYRVHRVVYELLVGPIPEGLQLDHTCHTNDPECPGGKTCKHRACCNPAHLEPVTNHENCLRGGNAIKTHCINGHEFTPQNTIITKNGWRRCRACQQAHHRRYLTSQRGR